MRRTRNWAHEVAILSLRAICRATRRGENTMKHGIMHALGLVAAALLALGAGPAGADAVGPYYATPSWDQTLPASTRFVVLSNFNSEAVLDRETGLVWEKSPATLTTRWDFGLTSCNERP